LQNINWVIVGGESGVSARLMREEWVRNIKNQCENQNISFFFKQWGTWGSDGKKRSKYANGKLLDGKIIQNLPPVCRETTGGGVTGMEPPHGG
jgi:protein gp37